MIKLIDSIDGRRSVERLKQVYKSISRDVLSVLHCTSVVQHYH